MRRMFSMKRPEQFKVSRHEPWNFFFLFTRLLFCWEEKNRKTAGTCPIHSRRRSPTFQKFPPRKTTWRIIIMSPDDLLLLTWPQTGISGLVGQYHITQLFTKAECVSWECSYYRVTQVYIHWNVKLFVLRYVFRRRCYYFVPCFRGASDQFEGVERPQKEGKERGHKKVKRHLNSRPSFVRTSSFRDAVE